jgi:hypothetical protein
MLEIALGEFRKLSEQSPTDIKLRWSVLGSQFRLAQARNDSASVELAVQQFLDFGGLASQPFQDRWITDLRRLAQQPRSKPQPASEKTQ